MSDTLHPALERLRKFRASWNKGDVIDEDSGFTADDIDTLLAWIADEA